MISAIFRWIPWWIFAFLAFNFATITLTFYEEYQADQVAIEQARTLGPPKPIEVTRFNSRAVTAPLGEVQLIGTLRADLGVRTVYFAETQYTFVLLDGSRAGPLVAIAFPATEAEEKLTQLVNATDSAGRVTVQGFIAPGRAGEISRRLAISDGISREVLVVEPYFGSREDAVTAQGSETQFGFFVALALTGFVAGMTVLRFRQASARRAGRSNTRAPQPTANAMANAAPSAPGPKPASGASPWGTFKPQLKQGAVKPQTVPFKPTPGPSNRPQPEAEDIPAQTPAFKSVFPGGGSQFQFKTPDQIIRQSFGTFRTIKRTPDRDDDADNATKADA